MVDLEAGTGEASAAAPASPPGSPASASHSLASGDIPAPSGPGDNNNHDGDPPSESPPHTPTSSPSKIVLKTVRTVLPKAEPIPWCTFFSLSFKVALP